jgi:hypothetical protein
MTLFPALKMEVADFSETPHVPEGIRFHIDALRTTALTCDFQCFWRIREIPTPPPLNPDKAYFPSAPFWKQFGKNF